MAIGLARALLRFRFLLTLLLLILLLRLLLRLRLRLRFLRRRSEVPNSFKRHARRRREDRLGIRHTLTASTRTGGRRHQRTAHTHVIHIEQIVLIAPHETRTGNDEHVITVFARIEKTRMRGARTPG